MKIQIDKLIKKYGDLEAVRKKLDISPRQMQYVLKGKHIGKHLEKVIKYHVKLMEMEDI